MKKFNLFIGLYISTFTLAVACAPSGSGTGESPTDSLGTEIPTAVTPETGPQLLYSNNFKGLGDVFYSLDGSEGVVVCFHGTGGSADGWTQEDDDKIDFLKDLAGSGWSFACPTSRDRTSKQWSPTNSELNEDVINVDQILNELGIPVGTSILLVGHSNGGGFTSRYAVFSERSSDIVGVQLSNASGLKPILAHPNYDFPTLFNYSTTDPIVDWRKVVENQQTLAGRSIPFIDNNLDAAYAAGDYEHDHKFVNTSLKILELLK